MYAFSIKKKVLTGLAFLHTKYHIHRDIKLENVLINTFGVVKLTDFGISKHLEATLDMCKTFVGTPNYMYIYCSLDKKTKRSPERCLGKNYSYTSDIWSLGVMALELALGEHPFPISSVFLQTLQNICYSPEPRLDETKYSPELCDFVKCCLVKEPMERALAKQLLNHNFITKYSHTTNLD